MYGISFYGGVQHQVVCAGSHGWELTACGAYVDEVRLAADPLRRFCTRCSWGSPARASAVGDAVAVSRVLPAPRRADGTSAWDELSLIQREILAIVANAGDEGILYEDIVELAPRCASSLAALQRRGLCGIDAETSAWVAGISGRAVAAAGSVLI